VKLEVYHPLGFRSELREPVVSAELVEPTAESLVFPLLEEPRSELVVG
jgi:hypothetical protein